MPDGRRTLAQGLAWLVMVTARGQNPEITSEQEGPPLVFRGR